MPVYEGVGKPIARDDFPIARPDIKSTGAVHGGYLDIPPATSRKQATGAVEFLIETYRAATEPIVLVPVGPMSNIATAFTAEPRLRDLVPELVIMGGANRYGNVDAARRVQRLGGPRGGPDRARQRGPEDHAGAPRRDPQGARLARRLRGAPGAGHAGRRRGRAASPSGASPATTGPSR